MTSPPQLAIRPGRSLARAAIGIGVVTVAARVVGFARGVVLVRTVGATCVGDTYYAANSIPNILFETVAGGALASAVVPLLARPLARGDHAEVRRIASALLTWAVVVLTPVALIGAVFATPIMRLLAGSSSASYDRGAVVALGARMLLVFLPQVVLYGVGVVLTGVLQAHRRFLGPALAPLLSSVVVMTAYGLYAAEGAQGPAGCAGVSTTRELTLSVGTTLGVVALSASLLVPLRACGIRLRPTLRLPPGVARRFVALAGAGVVALAAQQLALAVVLRLSYGGPPGTVVLYGLAWTVFLLPWAVLAVPIATSAFPELSEASEAGQLARYAGVVATTTRAVFAVSGVAVAVLVAAATPLSRLLVLHAAGHPDPAQLARALVAFAPGLVGYGLVAQATRALYARHAGGRAAAATVAGWLVVVVVDLVAVAALPQADTLLALGLGNSAGLTVAGLGLLTCLWSVAGRPAVQGLARTGLATLAGAAAGAAVGWWLATALPGTGLLAALWQGPAVAAVAAGLAATAVAAGDRRLLAAVRGRR